MNTPSSKSSLPRPTPIYKIGDTFLISEEALENYGPQFAGILFTIEGWYDHYVTKKEWNEDEDPHGNPYFDDDVSYGMSCLYDTTFPLSALYDFEMVYVPPSKRGPFQYTQLSLFED